MRSTHYLLRLTVRKNPVYIVEFSTLTGIINFCESIKQSYFVVTATKTNTPYVLDVEACQSGAALSIPLDMLYILDKNPVFRDNDEILHKLKTALLTHRLDK